MEELEKLRALLTRPEQSTVRIVVNPEKMVIREAQRSFSYLTLYDHITDALVVNRLVPDSASGEFAASWRRMQQRYMREIHEMFDPVPVLQIPQFPEEVVGIDRLREMGQLMHGDGDPAAFLVTERAYHIAQIDGEFEFQIPAPFVARSEAGLVRRGDELIVRMGAARRNIVLPRTLARMDHYGARLEDGILHIRFAPPVRGRDDAENAPQPPVE